MISAFWGSPRLSQVPLSLGEGKFQNDGFIMMAGLSHTHLRGFVDDLPKVFQDHGAVGFENGVWPPSFDKIIPLVEWMNADEGKIAKELMQVFHDVINTRSHTLVHGDFNCGNVWKGVGKGKSGFLIADWQLMDKCAPAFDFGTMIATADVTRVDGKPLELMKEYHRQLAEANPAAAESYPCGLIINLLLLVTHRQIDRFVCKQSRCLWTTTRC